MSFLDRIFRSRSEPITEEDFANYLGSEDPWTGIENIDRTSVMGLAAVWSAVRLISESIASLPLFFYKRTEDGKEKAVGDPLYDLLHIQPNPAMTSFYFRETMQNHLLFRGNAYAEIIRDGTGRAMELWPMNADNVTPYMGADNKRLYKYKLDGREIVLPREKVLHIPGLGWDGIKGYAPIEILMQQWGYSIAVKRYGSEFFRNNGYPGGYIALPQGRKLKDGDAVKRLKESWDSKHTEWGKKGKTGILEDGAEFKPINIPPEQAQFIESQKVSVTDIARVFRVPPHMIGDLDRATFSNIEQQAIDFVVNTLRPWLVRWEQELLVQIVPADQRRDYFYEFVVDALLRGDFQTRMAGYRTAIEMGVMSPNDVLSLENRNTYEGGDQHFVPLNWIPVDKAGRDMFGMGGEEPEEEENRRPLPREIRSAKSRNNVAGAYRKLLTDTLRKVVGIERRDLDKAIKKYLGNRSIEDFDLFLDKYYRGDFPDYLRKQLTPIYTAFMDSVKNEVSQEVGGEAKLDERDEDFVSAYVTLFINRYVAKSRKDIKSAVDKAVDVNADVGQALEDEFTHWENVRVPSTANDEGTRGSNAFAKALYIAAGVTVLRWVAMGDACPYCSSLSGAVVGVEQDFVMGNDDLVEQGKTLNVQHNVGHPPLHRGCNCQIVAGV